MERLFQPFYRAAVAGPRPRLYIASESASAHGGTLGVDCSPDERFTFRMPVDGCRKTVDGGMIRLTL
jgi:hypothetical protein